MNKIKHWNTGMVCVACIILLSFNLVVSAQPPSPPFNPWGNFTVYGSPAQHGSTVEAYINNTLIATTSTIFDYYSIIIPADNPSTPGKEGGVDGDLITVKIDGNVALQKLSWKGSNTDRVDLSVRPRTIVVNQSSPPCFPSGDVYYHQISQAVSDANDGDTVLVCPGNYNENQSPVEIYASVNISSYSGPSVTVINGNPAYYLFVMHSSNTIIDGFTLTGAYTGVMSAYMGGQTIGIPENNTIINNIITSNVRGIGTYFSNNNMILNNTIYGNTYGIFMDSSANNIIKNNSINTSDWGIHVSNSDNNTFIDNKINFNTYGICLSNSTLNDISKNTITENDYGIYLKDNSIDNNISYNNIFNNTNYDLYNDQAYSINAELNWWGTIYCTLIDSHIYDNEEGKGEVDFEPILNAPYPSGISIPCARLPLVVNQTSPACTPGYSYYPTIKGAVNNASSGDTIIVCPGTYNENVLVDVSVNIMSYAGPSVTIVKNASNPCEHVFNIVANDVNISGFSVTGTKPGPFAGICIWGDYCNISNNNAFNDDVGILIYSSNNVIANNTASNNSYGIYLYNSSDNTISNNIIRENKYDGIHLEDSSHNYIYLNNFVNNTNNVYSFKLKNIWNSSWKMTYVYDGKVWESYFGNYWDNYSGPDTNNDGIGDVPYAIDLDKDNYPLMEPFENYFVPTQAYIFDTGSPVNPYPSIMGNHTGTIKPNHTVIVTTLYTYSCTGTGGHTEYAEIRNATWNATATWKGYVGDWHNISFNKNVVLLANETYNYIIRTGSYPQIHHTDKLEVANDMGTITCDKFIDANGQVYYDWIPAIRLFREEGGDKK